jgi:hypothetical protein
MRILRVRPGFQADHSSSSYLFYAVDNEVSPAGQRVAHRYSSHADVNEQFARYQKWGDRELSDEAYPALLGTYFDVMASESYDSWTLMISVPKTAQRVKLLRRFLDLDDGEFTRLDVHDYGKRLAIEVHCEFDYEGPLFSGHGETLEDLVELLAVIRREILAGDVSFLEAVADFYGAGEWTEDDEDSEAQARPPQLAQGWTKSQLQQECERCGIPFRKSWTKDQLRQALTSASRPIALSRAPAGVARDRRPQRLSRAAREIVDSLDHR